MAERVMNIIIWPSVLLASTFGSVMIFYNQGLLDSLWMKIKLVIVFSFIVYVITCQYFLNCMRKGKLNVSENQLRFFSEGATLFLISIVSIASPKDAGFLDIFYGYLFNNSSDIIYSDKALQKYILSNN